MLSTYSLEIKNEYDIKTGGINKLAPNLIQRRIIGALQEFAIHLSQDLILKQIHRILEFKQSDWMKSYIDFNIQKRKEATIEADENLFKLSNNAVYGKTMKNMRKRVKIRILTNEKDFFLICLKTYIHQP